jgi:hypothetical protein
MPMRLKILALLVESDISPKTHFATPILPFNIPHKNLVTIAHTKVLLHPNAGVKKHYRSMITTIQAIQTKVPVAFQPYRSTFC